MSVGHHSFAFPIRSIRSGHKQDFSLYGVKTFEAKDFTYFIYQKNLFGSSLLSQIGTLNRGVRLDRAEDLRSEGLLFSSV